MPFSFYQRMRNRKLGECERDAQQHAGELRRHAFHRRTLEWRRQVCLGWRRLLCQRHSKQCWFRDLRKAWVLITLDVDSRTSNHNSCGENGSIYLFLKYLFCSYCLTAVDTNIDLSDSDDDVLAVECYGRELSVSYSCFSTCNVLSLKSQVLLPGPTQASWKSF